MSASASEHQVRAALRAAEAPGASPVEKATMLMEIAMGLQQRPLGPAQLLEAVQLYGHALEVCPPGEVLLAARIRARRGTALQAVPGEDARYLHEALADHVAAAPVFAEHGLPAEVAELEMNRGLVLQSLAAMGAANLQEAIAAYQAALRYFTREAHPREFAILHNNLATAFLSLPVTGEQGRLREALAVQSFEEALKVVTLEADPAEYAMLQNNLGNALQHVDSGHPVANCLRALDAYDAALRVRSADNMPVEYANTLANRAACLARLPDDPERPDLGQHENLRRARADYRAAAEIFERLGEAGRVALVMDMVAELEARDGGLVTDAGGNPGGESG